MTGSTARSGPKADYSGVGPVAASMAAALSSLAFFRVWGLFSMSLTGPGDMDLSGADLARQLRGPIPWLYVTPVAIVLVLVVSGARLVDPSPRVRFAYAVFLPLVAVTLLVWPVDALGKITRHFSRMQIQGEGTMRLTWWWWTYCVSLAIVMTLGIIELAPTFRKYMKNRTQGAVTRR